MTSAIGSDVAATPDAPDNLPRRQVRARGLFRASPHSHATAVFNRTEALGQQMQARKDALKVEFGFAETGTPPSARAKSANGSKRAMKSGL